MQKFDERWEESSAGFIYWTSRLEQLNETIKAEHGLDHLFAFPKDGEGPAEPSDLEGFILRGNYPPYLLDAIELFYDFLPDTQQMNFQKEFNQIMDESDLIWRMADGKIFPVDSIYINEEILIRTYQLLNEVKFVGALQEFEKARTDLVNGNSEGAIQNANLAVESTIKCILGIQRAKPGELYRRLIDSGLVPNYYKGFLKAFEDNILRSVTIMRNEEPGAGHGRGQKTKETPKSLAELAVNLTGVLINYLIRRYLETTSGGKDSVFKEDDIPF